MLRISLLLVAGLAAAQSVPPELKGVGVEEKLGQPVDLNLTFTAEDGYPVALREFFKSGKPVILDLVYYTCPMLCTRVLNGQVEALRGLDGTPGKDFEVLTISIDPRDTFDLAQKKKASYLASYGRPAPGWHFLTDDKRDVAKLASEVGFGYRFDERQGQYAHPAVIVVLTPEGKVSRYLYGIEFKPQDVRLALAEAAAGRAGISERILLYCVHYDPQAGGYVLFAANLMRAAGALTVVVLALVLWGLWRKERRRRTPVEVAAR